MKDYFGGVGVKLTASIRWNPVHVVSHVLERKLAFIGVKSAVTAGAHVSGERFAVLHIVVTAFVSRVFHYVVQSLKNPVVRNTRCLHRHNNREKCGDNCDDPKQGI
ncbi:MAG: hypothetical protein JOZ97_02040 [Candidatus Eremiobacteraeota bacterium]|nr:hypothetical protein [Candidatus Eremiobacteraeota bacterium]